MKIVLCKNGYGLYLHHHEGEIAKEIGKRIVESGLDYYTESFMKTMGETKAFVEKYYPRDNQKGEEYLRTMENDVKDNYYFIDEDMYVSMFDFKDRTHPELVKLVEELQPENWVIVEIPDDIKWKLCFDEWAGEWIEEDIVIKRWFAEPKPENG